MTTETTDPVCKMQVTVGPDTPHADYEGERHYFCSKHCQEKFQADPPAYLEPKAVEPERSGVMYTCPMHPEIRQPAPGNCPKCGMTLEPEMPVTAAVEYTCPCIPKWYATSQVVVRSAAWHWSRVTRQRKTTPN